MNMTSYYDLVLALIPVVFGGVAAILSIIGLSFTHAVPIAALGAVLLIGHAMFVRSPVQQISTVDRERPPMGDIGAD